jgi:hypothetical protein
VIIRHIELVHAAFTTLLTDGLDHGFSRVTLTRTRHRYPGASGSTR